MVRSAVSPPRFRGGVVAFFATSVLGVSAAYGQVAGTTTPASHNSYKPAEKIDPSAEPAGVPSDHPLVPALRLAVDSYRQLHQQIHDYSCLFVRRERIDGRLGPYEYMLAKVRHQREQVNGQVTPFGVYLRFLKPASVAGREVLFVEGSYEDRLIVRNGGRRMAYVVTELRPTSDLAMRGNRYPVTEFGLENLLRRLIQVAREDIQRSAPCEVKFFHQAKIDGRDSMGVQVRHTQQQEGQRFSVARIFWDRQLQVPTLFESYGWPETADDEPLLLEQYAYRNLQLNVGLSDAEFDRDFPQYHLGRRGPPPAGP